MPRITALFATAALLTVACSTDSTTIVDARSPVAASVAPTSINPMCTVGLQDDAAPGDADAGGSAQLAPAGMLRVGINYGNPNSAKLDPTTHTLSGVGVDLACRLAARLGVPLVFTGDVPGIPGYAGIPQLDAAFAAGAYDVGIAHSPLNPSAGALAHPYILIDNTFMVPNGSPFQVGTLQELDQAGVKVSVGHGNAPDTYLHQNARYLTIVDSDPTTGAPLTVGQARNLLLHGQVDAFAASPPAILPFLGTGFRMLPQPFLYVPASMFVPDSNVVGLHYLNVFIEWAKKKGYVADAIAAAGLIGVEVPPPEKVGGVGASAATAPGDVRMTRARTH